MAGSVARGPDFFGRDEELEELWRVIERDSVLLMALRRHGKTSHMYAMLDAPQPGWKVVLVDVEYIDEPAEFLTTLTAELLRVQPIRKHLLSKVSSLPRSLGTWLGSLTQEMTVGIPDVAELKLRLRDQLAQPETWPELAARVVLSCLSTSTSCSLPELAAALQEHHQPPERLDELLVMLEGDYYIARDGEAVLFADGLLRAWWRRNAPGIWGR